MTITAETLALYYFNNDTTLRKMEQKFGISKSKIHMMLHSNYHPPLRDMVQKKLQRNKMTAAYRGGAATRRKYQNAARKG